VIAPSPTPRGKLAEVPLAARRIWSLLYRATRRQAVAVDRHARELAELRRRVDELTRSDDQLVADVQELTGRVSWLEERGDPPWPTSHPSH